VGARESALASGLSSEQANRIYALILVTMHDAIAVGRDAASTRTGVPLNAAVPQSASMA
jgi:hypothetical protein